MLGVLEAIKQKAVIGECLYNEFELCTNPVDYKKMQMEEYIKLSDVEKIFGAWQKQLEELRKVSDKELARLEEKEKKATGQAKEAITRTMYFVNGEIQALKKAEELLKL